MNGTIKYHICHIIAIIFFCGVFIQSSNAQAPFREFIVGLPVIVSAIPIKLEYYSGFGRATMLALERYKGDVPDTFLIEWPWSAHAQYIDRMDCAYFLFLPQLQGSSYHDLQDCSLWIIDKFLPSDFVAVRKQEMKELRRIADENGYISAVRQPCLDWLELPKYLLLTVKNQPSYKYGNRSYDIILVDKFKHYLQQIISANNESQLKE